MFLFTSSANCYAKYTNEYDAAIESAVDKWWLDLPEWKLWKAQLIAESGLNTNAQSPVGAKGLAQVMPKTWSDIIRALKYPADVSPYDAELAVEGGAWYMAKLRKQWKNRPVLESHWLGAASYNRGTGWIIKDQAECNGALLWKDIEPCTLKHTTETPSYVKRIKKLWGELQ